MRASPAHIHDCWCCHEHCQQSRSLNDRDIHPFPNPSPIVPCMANRLLLVEKETANTTTPLLFSLHTLRQTYSIMLIPTHMSCPCPAHSSVSKSQGSSIEITGDTGISISNALCMQNACNLRRYKYHSGCAFPVSTCALFQNIRFDDTCTTLTCCSSFYVTNCDIIHTTVTTNHSIDQSTRLS